MAPITLSRTQFLYVALVLLVLLPAAVLLIVSPGLPSVWCKHFELADYEQTFGFKLGPLQPRGSGESVLGFASVAPDGVFARSGLRTGDVPSMYHGLGDLCGDLAAASEGREVELRVFNVAERQGDSIAWRRVPLRVHAEDRSR